MSDPISRWRYQHLMSRATVHLEPEDVVVSWARIKEPGRRRRGIAYLSRRGCLIHWTSGRDEHVFVPWEELRTWGIWRGGRGGVQLCLEGPLGRSVVQLPATTTGMAQNVSRFIMTFGDLAPWPEEVPKPGDGLERFEPVTQVDVGRERRSLPAFTKRVVVTVVGSALVLLGIVLSLPLMPGPGLLTIIAGLALLSTEFDFATDALDWARERYRKTRRRMKERAASRQE